MLVCPYHPGIMRRSDKWCSSGKHLVGDTSQSVLIAERASHSLELLRRHICRSANNSCSMTAFCVAQLDGNTKISKEGIAITIKKNIVRLEITMHNVLLVSVVKRIPDL